MKCFEKTALAYYKQTDESCRTLSSFSRNLNLAYLNGQLDPCYHRDMEIIQIQKILLRKRKANVLLTGVAGCGKTALVEATAAQITLKKLDYESACHQMKKEFKALQRARSRSRDADAEEMDEDFLPPPKPLLCDCVIYDLSLTALVGGTKYRGEFEERLQKIIAECTSHPEVIVFVDEAHLLTSAGRSDSSESAAQMLKPALARNDIRMIGATTLEEREYIAKDKALWRRFCEIPVSPLEEKSAEMAAVHILEDYCSFHKIVTDASAAELYRAVQQQLPRSVFPDNLINVIDETLASAVFDNRPAVGMAQFQQVLNRLSAGENPAK